MRGKFRQLHQSLYAHIIIIIRNLNEIIDIWRYVDQKHSLHNNEQIFERKKEEKKNTMR